MDELSTKIRRPFYFPKSKIISKVEGKRIAVWGLAFKPDTDEKSADLIDQILEEGATICAFDPEAMDNVKSLLSNMLRMNMQFFPIVMHLIGGDFSSILKR